MQQVVAAVGEHDGLALALPKGTLFHQFDAAVESSHRPTSLPWGGGISQKTRRKANWQRRAVVPSGKALEALPVPAPATGFKMPL